MQRAFETTNLNRVTEAIPVLLLSLVAKPLAQSPFITDIEMLPLYIFYLTRLLTFHKIHPSSDE